jgi:glycosyltransferase involved in cell wall biosynthesis
MKRILLVDLNSWSGHHRPYFLLYTKLLLKLNYQLDVLCLGADDIQLTFPQEIADETIKIIQPKLFLYQRLFIKIIEFSKKLNINFLISNPSSLGLWWFVRNAAIEKKSKNESFVFILDLQGYLVDLPIFLQNYLLPKSWAGLSIWSPPQDLFVRQIQSNLPIYHPSCKSFGLLNERLVKELDRKLGSVSVDHFPDVSYLQCNSEDPALVLEVLKIAGQRKIVFLASLTKKHGLIHFLRLADEMTDSKVLFCAMGLLKLDEYDPTELEYIDIRLSNPPENLLVLKDIYPVEETLNALYRISDVAFVCYENFQHSSNKLTKAIGLGTPVIVASDTLLAERVKTYQLGFAVDPNNLSAMAKAVNLLLYNFEFDENLRTAFVNYHSEQMLLEKLTTIFQ